MRWACLAPNSSMATTRSTREAVPRPSVDVLYVGESHTPGTLLSEFAVAGSLTTLGTATPAGAGGGGRLPAGPGRRWSPLRQVWLQEGESGADGLNHGTSPARAGKSLLCRRCRRLFARESGLQRVRAAVCLPSYSSVRSDALRSLIARDCRIRLVAQRSPRSERFLRCTGRSAHCWKRPATSAAGGHWKPVGHSFPSQQFELRPICTSLRPENEVSVACKIPGSGTTGEYPVGSCCFDARIAFSAPLSAARTAQRGTVRALRSQGDKRAAKRGNSLTRMWWTANTTLFDLGEK